MLAGTRREQVTLERWLKRQETTWGDLVEWLPELSAVPADVARQVTYDVKYSGYVARQEVEIDRQRRLSERRIPESLDYATLGHLRAEAREKLSRVRPRDLAQAGRISGITPADLAVLMVHLDGKRSA
jgi:tRNA uridine 5-carboxymethylaminomethyl modification enzyme